MKKALLALALLSVFALAAAYWYAVGYGWVSTTNGPAYFSFKAFQATTTAYGSGGASTTDVSRYGVSLAIVLGRGEGSISGSTLTLDGPGLVSQSGVTQQVPVTLTATDNGATGDTFSITAHTNSGDVSIGGVLQGGQIVIGQG